MYLYFLCELQKLTEKQWPTPIMTVIMSFSKEKETLIKIKKLLID